MQPKKPNGSTTIRLAQNISSWDCCAKKSRSPRNFYSNADCVCLRFARRWPAVSILMQLRPLQGLGTSQTSPSHRCRLVRTFMLTKHSWDILRRAYHLRWVREPSSLQRQATILGNVNYRSCREANRRSPPNSNEFRNSLGDDSFNSYLPAISYPRWHQSLSDGHAFVASGASCWSASVIRSGRIAADQTSIATRSRRRAHSNFPCSKNSRFPSAPRIGESITSISETPTPLTVAFTLCTAIC